MAANLTTVLSIAVEETTRCSTGIILISLIHCSIRLLWIRRIKMAPNHDTATTLTCLLHGKRFHLKQNSPTEPCFIVLSYVVIVCVCVCGVFINMLYSRDTG